MGSNTGCAMCQNCPAESAIHLIFLCPKATEVWYEMSVQVGYRLLVPDTTIEGMWSTSKEQANRRGGQIGKEWGSFFACTCWHIWKRRNEKVFAGNSTLSQLVAEKIGTDGRLWIKFCNRGWRTLMGTNLLPEPD